MIRIGQPYVYRKNDKWRLESTIWFKEEELKIYYEVSEEYGRYLCPELSDAFLCLLLPYACSMESDILIEGNVSPTFLDNCRHIQLPLLSAALKKRCISITSGQTEPFVFHGTAVATGCSLGVDSLSAIYQLRSEEVYPAYRLTHLAIFNSCQLGTENQTVLEQELQKAIEKSGRFAAEMGLPLLAVNSNLNELFGKTFLSIHTVFLYNTVSCALSLQKLLSRYVVASSYSAQYIQTDLQDLSYTEALLLPALSTDSMQILVADTFTNRVEKTAYISSFPQTPNYLDVCWATQMENLKDGRKEYSIGKTHRNCGWCDKCMRTLFTLELLGKIEDYADAFDLDQYRNHRKDFIIKVFANAKYNNYYREIVSLMKDKNFPVPIVAYLARTVNVKDSKLILWLWQNFKKLRQKLSQK